MAHCASGVVNDAPNPAVDDGRLERIARNEVLFRGVNEEIAALNTWGAGLTTFPIVCECGTGSCTETLRVPCTRYEAVRSRPERFIVKPGHELPEVEDVVEEGAEFHIVEKREGAPSRIARGAVPRD